MDRWRGLKALVHDAVDRTVDLVEEGHESAARTALGVLKGAPGLAGPAEAIDALRRASTGVVLGTIRGVNRAIEHTTDAALDAAGASPAARGSDAIAMRSDTATSGAVVADAAIGLLNGVVGDYLRDRRNGLDLGMALRLGDRYLPALGRELADELRGVGPRLCVFVHGLGTTEWSWCLNAAEYHGDASASFGTLLARDLGYTPLWLRYNSGRHVSENGRELAARLQSLIDAWPVPVGELLLVGHSMGGLVVRSACHYAREGGLPWPSHVRRVFCLGSPHQGTALEKLGHVATTVLSAIDVPGTQITARIARARSAGIKDLRHGSLVDDDWLGKDPDAASDEGATQVPLLDAVAYHFVSASITRDPEHPLGQLVGDMLVRVPSASGPQTTRDAFAIETSHVGGVLHHQLQNHPDVYEQIRRACAADAGAAPNAEPEASP